MATGIDTSTAISAVSGGTALSVFALVRFAEVLHKAIPDSATGWKAVVRKIAGIIGVYVKNKP